VQVLGLVPDHAEAVAYYPNPKRLEQKWSALVGLFGEKASFLELKSKTGIDPSRLGSGPLVKVSFAKAGPAESWVWLIPTPQPKAALQGLDAKGKGGGWTWKAPVEPAKKGAKASPSTPLYGTAQAGFLLVANHEQALAAFQKPKGTLSQELSPYATWLERHDVSLVATKHGVERAATEAGQSFKAGAGKPKAGEAPESQSPKAPKRLQSKLEGWMESARTSVHHVLAGLDLTAEGGLQFEAQARLTKGSSLSRNLETLAPVAGHPLAGLTARNFALALGGDWSGLFDLQGAVLEDLDKAGKAQPATKERMQKALEAQGSLIRSWGASLAAPAAGQPMLSGLTSLIRLADSRAYVSATEDLCKAQNAFFEELGMPGAVTFTPDALPGVPSCSVTTRMAGKGEDPAAAQMRQGMAMAFGGEALQVSTGALDEHRVLVVLGGPEQLKARLDESRKGPVGLPASVAAVEPDLGVDHRFALYLDLRGLRDLAQLAAGMFMGPEAKPLPAVPEVPALGVALSLDPSMLELRGSVRGETLRAAAAFFKAAKSLLPADKKPGKGAEVR
jgi:hypothetical protein